MRLAKKQITDLIAIVTVCLRLDKECVTISNRKWTTALTVFAFCLAAVQGTASAAIVHVNENLNNNLVPSDFSLNITNTAGLANGRLQATAVNGTANLVYNTLPSNLSQIDISYRGHFGYSLWGTYTEVSFGGLPINLTHGVNEYTQGLNNFASIGGGGTSTSPLNYSNFEYAITVIDGQVSYTGTDSATNIQAFNLTHSDAGILLADINQIGFRTHNTTGTEPVWLDDISMQLHTVPVSAVPIPATVWLFGTALLGLIGFGKRRKAA